MAPHEWRPERSCTVQTYSPERNSGSRHKLAVRCVDHPLSQPGLSVPSWPSINATRGAVQAPVGTARSMADSTAAGPTLCAGMTHPPFTSVRWPRTAAFISCACRASTMRLRRPRSSAAVITLAGAGARRWAILHCPFAVLGLTLTCAKVRVNCRTGWLHEGSERGRSAWRPRIDSRQHRNRSSSTRDQSVVQRRIVVGTLAVRGAVDRDLPVDGRSARNWSTRSAHVWSKSRRSA